MKLTRAESLTQHLYLCPCNRQIMGLLVMTLVLLSEGVAITHAIELERVFNAASSTFFGRKNTEGKSPKASSPSPSTECSAGSTTGGQVCLSQKKQKPGIFSLSVPSNRPGHRFNRSKTTIQKEEEQLCHIQHQDCMKCAASATSSPSCTAAFSKSPSKLTRSALRDLRGGHGAHSHDTPSSGAGAVLAHPTPYGIPLFAWKIIFQFFLTAMNVLCWYIPLKHKSLRENDLGLSLANAFSGGVFLSLAFGHLIPECVAGFPSGYSESLPYMMMLGGYLLIFFVEKVAFDVHLHNEENHHHHETSSEKKHNGIVSTASTASTGSNGQTQSGASSGRSAVILLGALAIHSILEMASLGLSRSFGDAALLSLSIGLHQPAESIALLVAFLKSGMTQRQIISYLSVFSAMGPIGVAVGMAVNEFATPLVDAIMLAVVAGTFIYVGATEVIPEEWESQDHKWIKFFALMSGIVSIFVITQYTMTLEV